MTKDTTVKQSKTVHRGAAEQDEFPKKTSISQSGFQPPVNQLKKTIISQRKVQQATSGMQPVIQRAINDSDWTTLDNNLSTQVVALITLGEEKGMLTKGADGTYKFHTQTNQVGTVKTMAELKANYTWSKKFKRVLRKSDADIIDFGDIDLQSNIDKEGDDQVKMDVQEPKNAKHSMLHYSYSTYKKSGKGRNAVTSAREANHHLTMENAHLLMMQTLANDKTLAYLDKTKLDKPGVNEQLTAQGITSIDNINWFPKKNQQMARDLSIENIKMDRLPAKTEDEGGEDVNENFSLQQYLDFVAKAMSQIENVPPVYGAKILDSAKKIAAATHFNPAELYLKKGKGDDNNLVKAILAMDKFGLVSGLNIPDNIKAIFKYYVTSQPSLPKDDNVEDSTEWLKEGESGYNQRERSLVTGNFNAIINAVKTYLE